MIRARAVLRAGFKLCCMKTGKHDGTNRDYFFWGMKWVRESVERCRLLHALSFSFPNPNSALAIILSFGKHSDVRTPQVQIRRLNSSEGVAYREIRLEALRGSPEAFGSTHEAESARPLEHFSERVAACPVFGAFRDAELVGMAGFLGREGLKDAHKGDALGNVRSATR